jgi:hypothetical protein
VFIALQAEAKSRVATWRNPMFGDDVLEAIHVENPFFRKIVLRAIFSLMILPFVLLFVFG